ncbi:hypothetical protein [Spirosoma endophyticum]|uniref:4-amino-4-deoxy-L-arabinose transferase n=1 Tax=Spirosoma endophyticum TaxID=662367 RepID=A0A1I1U1M0_9BACT|nr:hypothetical protein [Spirosoma endophyticum]SFD64659.1 hypothetical protein SAMN05216167_10686 [Spirosoma endophyticum]
MNSAYISLRQALIARSTTVALALVVIPFLCFGLLLFTYVVNVPWMDDIETFLNFMLGYTGSHTIGEKLDWLLRPNNEHRMLVGKLITLALYKLTGTVNFRWLIFAAFAFFLGIVLVLYRVFRSINLPLIAFVPVPFLMLQPQSYLTTMWAITGMQHEVVIALVITSLFLLANGSRNQFAGGLGLQILASFSMSNGLFGWAAGAVLLATQRQWGRLGIWLVAGVGAVLFYFHDFQNAQGNDSSITFFLANPHLTFFGFFTFTGGLFDFFFESEIFRRSILPTIAGMILIPVMLWLLWRMNKSLLRGGWSSDTPKNQEQTALWKRRYFFTGCYTFLMVNAVIIAFLRPRFGYFVMLVSNYMIYPALLVSLLYLNVLSEEYQNRKIIRRWMTLGAGISLMVWGVWYVLRMPKVAYRKQELLTNAYNQKRNDVGLGASLGTTFAQSAQRWMDDAVAKGMYQYPAAFYTPYEQMLQEPIAGKPTSTIPLLVREHPDVDLVRTNAWRVPDGLSNACFIVKSTERTYLFPVPTLFSPKPFFLGRSIPVLESEILKTSLYPGTYKVGILLHPTQGPAIQYLDHTITVQ